MRKVSIEREGHTGISKFKIIVSECGVDMHSSCLTVVVIGRLFWVTYSLVFNHPLIFLRSLYRQTDGS